MPEYGDYKKELKTLGDLREFVNNTLKDLQDDYTFDIDNDFSGEDITLLANCDVSYSERDFYWSANVNLCANPKKIIDEKNEFKKRAKAWEIAVKKNVDFGLLRNCEDVNEYNSIIQGAWQMLTEEEFELLKSLLKME